MLKRVIIAIAVIAFAKVCIEKAYDEHTIRKGMPPGYYLEVSNQGHHRACSAIGLPLLSSSDEMTKAQAIRRAWREYEYEQSLDGGWRNVE